MSVRVLVSRALRVTRPSVPRALRKEPRMPCVWQRRCLRTSHVHRVGFFMTPLARVLAAVGGRITRLWWKRLSPEQKAAIFAVFSRNRIYVLAGVGGLCVCAEAYYLSHLQVTPITERKRFVMFSQADLVDLIKSEKEEIMKMLCKGQQPLPASHPSYQRVLAVLSVILAKNWSEIFDDINWRLYVIDKPEVVNAICLPSGEIFVFTGLLKACRNANELAFILSHEIAHAVLGHGAEGFSHRGVIEFFSLFFVAVLWTVVPNDLAAYFLHRFSHSTAQVLLDFPYSRKLEAEADRVGLQFAANACFDPGEAVQVWTHLPTLRTDNGDEVVDILSTHPSNTSRLQELSALLPSAYSTWQQAECETEMREEVKSFQDTVKNTLENIVKWW